MQLSRSMLIGAGLLALSYASPAAQEITGTPGSPGAATFSGDGLVCPTARSCPRVLTAAGLPRSAGGDG
jgi:hypothetical protein